jgi:hypothetical protein
MKLILTKWPTHLGVGIVSGAAIVYIDNCAFEGEASPIIIVAMLLVVTALAGAWWGRGGWVSAAITWAFIPLAHIVKHVFGLPDTLNPNTYASILFLGAFTLVVATCGTGCGVLLHKLSVGSVRGEKRSA